MLPGDNTTENNQQNDELAFIQPIPIALTHVILKQFEIKQNLSYIFQTLEEAKDDFVSTFKKYRQANEVLIDLAQPFFGILNILGGTISLILSLPLILRAIYLDIRRASSVGDYFANQVPTSASMVGTHLLDAEIDIARGLSQIAATPLMLAKVVFRGLLTLGSALKSKLFGNSESQQATHEQNAHDELLQQSTHAQLMGLGITQQPGATPNPAPVSNPLSTSSSANTNTVNAEMDTSAQHNNSYNRNGL